jgi:hypothetical protein
MPGMSVTRIHDGLWSWTCPHPEWDGATDWDEVVGSVYCEVADATVVIDPLVPAEPAEAERFWRAFDRDVERRGLPVVVLLTCRWHVRSTWAFRDRYDARIVAPCTTGHALEDGAVEAVADGESPVAGVVALVTGSPAPNEECIYVLTDHRTAVAGDILLGDPAGGVRVAPAAWYANTERERVWFREELVSSLSRVAEYPIDRLLLGHGAPVGTDLAVQLSAAFATRTAG